MDIPQDFSDPFYDYAKKDVIGVLTGPAAAAKAGPERAMRMIVANGRGTLGFSEGMVRSMPEWKRMYGNAEETAPVTDGEVSYGDNSSESLVHSVPSMSTEGTLKDLEESKGNDVSPRTDKATTGDSGKK